MIQGPGSVPPHGIPPPSPPQGQGGGLGGLEIQAFPEESQLLNCSGTVAPGRGSKMSSE